MLLVDLLGAIGVRCGSHPLVGDVFYGSPLVLSQFSDVKYSAISYSLGEITLGSDGYALIPISLFYIDVLGEVSQVQSDGVNVLTNITGGWPALSRSFVPFVHRFLDDTAGVELSLTLRCPYTRCYDDYDTGHSFNLSFNISFDS